VKALEGSLNQEKAIVRAFFVIVKKNADGSFVSFAALLYTLRLSSRD